MGGMISRFRRANRGVSLEFQPGLSSIQRLLETPLAINGQSPTPGTLRGYDAAAGGWADYTTPANVATLQTGTAPSYGEKSPLLGTIDPGVLFAGGGYFKFASAAVWDVAALDPVIELLFRVPAAAAEQVLVSKSTGAGTGWSVTVTAAGLLSFNCHDGTDSTAVVSAALVRTSYVYAIGFFRKAGSGQWYIQGAASGAAVDLSSIGSLTNANGFSLGAHSNGTVPLTGALFLAQLWQFNPLDSHLQPTVAAQRAQSAFGNRPQKYWGPSIAPTAAGSASPAYQSRVESDGSSRIYQIGAGSVQRFQRVLDSAGRAMVGVLNEGAVQNLCPYSLTYSSWTTRARLSVPATPVKCIDGITRTTVVLHEDGTASNNHFLQNAFSIASGVPHVLSLRAKPINRTWLMPQANGKVVSYQLTGAGVIGTAVGAVTPYIEYLGEGWYLIWQTFTSSSTTGNPTIFLAEADNDNSFDGLDQDSIAISHVQIELGNYPSMPVDSGAVATTRAADSFILPATGNIGLPEGGVRVLFWAPAGWVPLSRRTLFSVNSGAAADRIESYLHTDGTLCVETAKTGGLPGILSWPGSKCDGLIHELLLGWSGGLLTGALDGVWATPGTAVDIITAATQLSVGQDHAATNNAGPAIVVPFMSYTHRPTSWYDRGGHCLLAM